MINIYTSYFANIAKLPENIIPVAISEKVPDKYVGLRYKKLAPLPSILYTWKQDHNDIEYIIQYQEKILNKLSPTKVIQELEDLTGTTSANICLICYEKPKDFCHRHLVAMWLQKNGISCEEY